MGNSKSLPRLCIDTRGARAYASQGVIAEELVNFLVSETSADDEVETVLLSHPSQEFQAKSFPRFDTRRRIGASPLYRFWEKNFIRNAELELFHRFRPLDELGCFSAAKTLTTVCPAHTSKKVSSTLGQAPNQHFIVPSEHDRALLIKEGGALDENISVIRPSIRKSVRDTHFSLEHQPSTILFITGDKNEGLNYSRMGKVIGERFPNLNRKFISLSDEKSVSPPSWTKLLSKTKACFYLSARSCDWPTLALEAFFWGIPTIFQDKHPTLSELIPNSRLELSRFLIDEITDKEIAEDLAVARKKLEAAGCFEPERMAKEFKRLQLELAKEETHLTI
jgi:hypothetical protein